MRSYGVTSETAAAARSVGVSMRISEKGKYKGKLILAEAVKSTQGTEGIEFRFKGDDGQMADYLTVWTHKADGTELSGAKLITAIMVCLQTRSCAPQRASVKKWDAAQKAEVNVDAQVFPELMNKPIGLLIAMEEREKDNGARVWNPMIVAPFEHSTERVAAEILDKKPAGEALPKMVQLLKDRPLRAKGGNGGGSNGGGSVGGGSQGRQQTSFDNMDDDIPF